MGYRLLQEYFAFPARYLFVKLNGLRDGMSRCEASEVEVLFLSDVHEPSLDGVVNAQHSLSIARLRQTCSRGAPIGST